MKKSEFQSRIKEAIDLVKEVPTEYRPFAFHVALLGSIKPENSSVEKKQPKKQSSDYLKNILISDFDWTVTRLLDLKPNLQNLQILKIVKEHFGINKLTANDIQSILSQKFRIKKTPNAISMSLMEEVGKHVSRIPEGNKFYYEITTNGIVYLDSKVEKEEQT